MPAQHDLARRLAVGLAELDEHRLVQDAALGQRAPRLGDDAQLVVLVAQARLLEVGVQLDLVDGRGHARLGDDPLQVGGLEVGDADGAGQARLLGVDERLPGLDEEVLGRHGQWMR